MISERIKKYYREARRHKPLMLVGQDAVCSYRIARTLALWETLEGMGLVRLTAEPDDDYDGSDVCQCEPDGRPERHECGPCRLYHQGGAWGSIGQYRLTEDDEWVDADSCWGHVGYEDVLDWRENPYILDHMAETIDQFKAAHKLRVSGMCPTCHGTGKASR